MKNLFENKKTTLSFEVFPPKKEEEFPGAIEVLNQLSELHPDFISVTYGAGGSRSKKTVDIASYIHNTLHIPALAHITCVGNTKGDIDEVVSQLQAAHIENVLALRGDRPAYMSDEQYHSREFAHATDLITYLRETTSLHIAGACYPEKHYEAVSLTDDLKCLAKKADCGAELLITQLFFDNDLFYHFEEKARTLGITIPICAGVMPITTAKQLGTTVSLSGSSVPKKLADLIATYGDNPEDMKKAGIAYAADQLNDLKRHLVNGIHIYSMNKPKTTAQIVSMLDK